MSKKKGPRSCTSSWQPEAYWTPSIKSKFPANCCRGFWAHITVKHKEHGWKYGACPQALLSCPKYFNKDPPQKVRRLLSPAVFSGVHAVSAQSLLWYHLMPFVCPELLLAVGSCAGGAFLHIQPCPSQGSCGLQPGKQSTQGPHWSLWSPRFSQSWTSSWFSPRTAPSVCLKTAVVIHLAGRVIPVDPGFGYQVTHYMWRRAKTRVEVLLI